VNLTIIYRLCVRLALIDSVLTSVRL
jgi:hypothetical protein